MCQVVREKEEKRRQQKNDDPNACGYGPDWSDQRLDSLVTEGEVLVSKLHEKPMLTSLKIGRNTVLPQQKQRIPTDSVDWDSSLDFVAGARLR